MRYCWYRYQKGENHLKLTSTLIRSVAVGALGGILFGFDTAVIAGTLDQLTQVFVLSPKMVGILVSTALWGTVAGCFMAGPLGQKFGSRTVLRLMALFYVVSAVGCAIAPNLSSLMIARFVGGLGIGGSSVLGPVYIAEISPANLRGRLVGTFQINIVVGILLAYVSNWWLAALAVSHSALVSVEWRWQLGVAALPAILFFVMLYTVPQSARFLITQDSVDNALRVLREMGSADPQADIQAMRKAMREESLDKTTHLFCWSLRWPIFLAVSIGFFNQVSGINAILYYANQIFSSAGLDRMSGFQRSIFIGLATLLPPSSLWR